MCRSVAIRMVYSPPPRQTMRGGQPEERPCLTARAAGCRNAARTPRRTPPPPHPTCPRARHCPRRKNSQFGLSSALRACTKVLRKTGALHVIGRTRMACRAPCRGRGPVVLLQRLQLVDGSTRLASRSEYGTLPLGFLSRIIENQNSGFVRA